MSALQGPRCPVQCSSSWLCHGDVSSVLHVSGPHSAASSRRVTDRVECVTLELPSSKEDGLTCILSLLCVPQGIAHILDVTLFSEARTIEVYNCTQDSQEEEYLGTSRGERHCTFSGDGKEDHVTLYKAHLKLDVPVPACKVKLLSLGGRRSVLVREISVELTSIPETCSQMPPSFLGPSINLERVQSIMDSVGGKMSPGAERLMTMVRAQQKLQNEMPFGPHLLQMFGNFMSGRGQNKHDSCAETRLSNNTAGSRTEINQPSEYPISCHQELPSNVNSLMSPLLQKQMDQTSTPESILPLLQNLALQKNQSAKDSCLMSREEKVDPVLEKLLLAQMERMEKNLLKHIDQRMKHLQDHLDSRIDQLAHLLENSRLDQHPVTSGDKLFNGHIGHSHEKERDSDVFNGH